LEVQQDINRTRCYSSEEATEVGFQISHLIVKSLGPLYKEQFTCVTKAVLHKLCEKKI